MPDDAGFICPYIISHSGRNIHVISLEKSLSFVTIIRLLLPTHNEEPSALLLEALFVMNT